MYLEKRLKILKENKKLYLNCIIINNNNNYGN